VLLAVLHGGEKSGKKASMVGTVMAANRIAIPMAAAVVGGVGTPLILQPPPLPPPFLLLLVWRRGAKPRWGLVAVDAVAVVLALMDGFDTTAPTNKTKEENTPRDTPRG